MVEGFRLDIIITLHTEIKFKWRRGDEGERRREKRREGEGSVEKEPSCTSSVHLVTCYSI
jgi:hypothetical protein